jgi:hypothetical protein
MTEELKWRKSSYSGAGTTNDCVEVAESRAGVHLRDSKDPDGDQIIVSKAGFAAFINSLRNDPNNLTQ